MARLLTPKSEPAGLHRLKHVAVTDGGLHHSYALALRDTAFADPRSYFHQYAALSDRDAKATAERIWHEINEPNLVQNILPTRGRATLVIRKAADHSVTGLRLRKR